MLYRRKCDAPLVTDEPVVGPRETAPVDQLGI